MPDQSVPQPREIFRIGRIVTVTGTDPAAGSEFSEIIPAGKMWKLVALSVQFVTSAVASNRTPRLVFDDGATIFYSSLLLNSMPASTTTDLVWSIGGGKRSQVITALQEMHIFDCPYLPAGYRIRSVTGGLLAGDNYSAPIMLIEESTA